MQQYIEPTIPVVVFVALYFVGRIKPIGRLYGFVFSLVGMPFAHLATYLNEYHTTLKKRVIKETDKPLLSHIHGLLMLVLGLVIFTGDGYNAYIAAPSLIGTSSSHLFTLPTVIDFASASLFVAPAVMCGVLCIEMFGYAHTSEKLFPHIVRFGTWSKRLIVGATLLSVLLTLSYFLFRVCYIADPTSDLTTTMRFVVFALLGVVVPLAAIISYVAVHYGLSSCIVIVLWCWSLLLTLIAFIASLIADLCEFVSLHFSNLTPRTSHGAVNEGAEKPGVPQTQPSEQLLSFPSPKENEVTQMPKHVISLLSGGEYGTHCISPVVSIAQKLQLTPFSSASVDLTSFERVAFDLGVDCSLTFLEQMAEKAFASNDKDAYAKIFTRTGHKLVDTHLPVQNAPGVVLAFLDKRIGSTAFPMLRDINRRLPYHRIVVVTEIAENEIDQPDVQAFIQGLTQLHQDGVLRTTIVTSPRSKFALHHGAEIQTELSMQAILSLLCSLSCVSILDGLSTHSPFISLSFSTAPIALSGTPVRYFWLKWFTKKAVVGDVNDAITQAVHCSELVMRDPKTQAFDAGSQAEPSYLVYNCPFADGRFYKFQQRVTQDVVREFPPVKTLAVSSNGIPYIQPSQSPFLVQVSRFSPVTLSVLTPATKGKEVKEPTALVPPLSSEETISLVPFTATPDTITKNSSNGIQRRVRGRASKKVEK